MPLEGKCGIVVGIANAYGGGRLRDPGSSPSRVKNFHFSVLSKPGLGLNQTLMQWLQGALSPEGKAAGA